MGPGHGHGDVHGDGVERTGRTPLNRPRAPGINLPVDDAVITDLATAATAGITALADRHHSTPAEPPSRTDRAVPPG
ncbi:hypothetical protein [Streptomyces sp. NPDC094147]|uniref:hypothetical protein n=1 Tax=Streptomyces sp. NPDC094147 TaxID=3366057 RepID=UPI0038194567